MSRLTTAVIFVAATAGFAGASSAPLAADFILRRADRAILGETAVYTIQMTVVRSERPDRVVELKGFKKGDDLGLMKYTVPAKELGTAYLRKGASTWLFLPAADKIVGAGARQNFGGGDFTNGDVFRLSLAKDYLATFSDEEEVEGQACYKLDLKAKDRAMAYDHVVYWIRSDGTFFPVRADYYTLSGRMLKSLVASEVGTLGKRKRPLLLTMQSALEAGAKTTLRFLAIEDDVPLDDRLFTPSALEQR